MGIKQNKCSGFDGRGSSPVPAPVKQIFPLARPLKPAQSKSTPILSQITRGTPQEVRMSKRYAAMAALGCLLLFCSMNLFGQATASAGLQGAIVDKTQATVTGASVTVTNKATGETRTTKADASGEYRFTFLPAGIYNLRVSAPSFSTAEARDVELLVGNTSTQNFTLSPGAVNETVEVGGCASCGPRENR